MALYKHPDGHYLNPGEWFVIGDQQYPPKWLGLSSDSEKTALGITIEADPVVKSFDSAFYDGYDDSGNLIDKSLTDVNVVDESNNPVLDPNTGKALVNKGLTNIWLKYQDDEAYQLIRKYDWYANRKSFAGTAIPTDVTTYVAAVRTACTTRKGEISACSSTTALSDLINKNTITKWPDDPS